MTMLQTSEEKKGAPTFVWVVALVCVGAIIFALCGGAAYASVQQAKVSAAKASIGHIEAVLLLAEKEAEDSGLGAPPAAFSTLLKSYDSAGAAILPEYERTVLTLMLDSFGVGRDFDFAINRFSDGAGAHTQIYFFPVRGKTNVGTDKYYLLSAGQLTENN